MSSACTLVCASKSFSAVHDAIGELFPGDLVIQGKPESGEQIELHLPRSVMVFTTLIRKKPGDQFSKLVLSMHNFFRKVKTLAIANKNFVLERVANTEMFIGVIVEPEFLGEDRHFDCIWLLAERLNAMVFFGEAMLNARGQRILSQTGEADVVL